MSRLSKVRPPNDDNRILLVVAEPAMEQHRRQELAHFLVSHKVFDVRSRKGVQLQVVGVELQRALSNQLADVSSHAYVDGIVSSMVGQAHTFTWATWRTV